MASERRESGVSWRSGRPGAPRPMAGKFGYSSLLPWPGRVRLGRMRTVLMALFDQVQSLDVTGPLEAVTGANSWRGGRGDGPAHDIRTASLGRRPVPTSSRPRIA